MVYQDLANNMKHIALTLPGNQTIDNPPGLNPNINSLGSLLSALLIIVFYIAIFLAFYYLLWGAFQYILASGKKEDLAKARSKITWALVGLIVIFSSFFLAKFAAQILPPGNGGLPF